MRFTSIVLGGFGRSSRGNQGLRSILMDCEGWGMNLEKLGLRNWDKSRIRVLILQIRVPANGGHQRWLGSGRPGKGNQGVVVGGGGRWAWWRIGRWWCAWLWFFWVGEFFSSFSCEHQTKKQREKGKTQRNAAKIARPVTKFDVGSYKSNSHAEKLKHKRGEHSQIILNSI